MSDEPWRGMPEPQPWPAPTPLPTPTPGAADEPNSLTARLKRLLAPLGALGAFLAKFGLLLLKLKSVVFLGSAAISILAYAQVWGWEYAVGFVLMILLHELGHVFALRARGIKNSALVFLPMLGAFTSWKATPRSDYEEAETAFAGPVLGTVAALAAAYVGHAHHSPLLLSLAFTGFVINLFNLVPVLPLDGGKVNHLLHPVVWVIGVVGLLCYELYRPGALVVVLLILAGVQVVHQLRDRDGDYARTVAALEPGQRAFASSAYLILVAVILLGMHATYAVRHIS